MPKRVVVPAPVPVPVPATLSEQKADFTAEGAPPPGKVATMPPISKDGIARPAPAVPKASSKAAKQSPKRAG